MRQVRSRESNKNKSLLYLTVISRGTKERGEKIGKRGDGGDERGCKVLLSALELMLLQGSG